MKKIIVWGLLFFAVQGFLMLLIVGGLVLIYAYSFGKNLESQSDQYQPDQYEERQEESVLIQAEADYPYCTRYRYCFSDGELSICNDTNEKLYTFETLSCLFDGKDGKIVAKDGNTAFAMNIDDHRLLPDQDWWYFPYAGTFTFMENEFTVRDDLSLETNENITQFTPTENNRVLVVCQGQSYNCLLSGGEITDYYEIQP